MKRKHKQSTEFFLMDDLTFALREIFFNVENTLGFLTGIGSKHILYARFENEPQIQIIPCAVEKSF